MLDIAEIAILGVAGYRSTQLAVHDAILEPARDAVYRWHARRVDSRLRTAMVTLISCVYCMGWWISGLILATYLTATSTWSAAPPVVHGIEWLAVAGAAVLLNRWDDTRDTDTST